MRKMLSAKAGATFSMDCPEFTFAVRKDVVEIIYKVKPGVYLVVNFARVDATHGMLFVNWGRFWDRMTNERLQLQKVEKCSMRLKMLMIYNELVKNPPFPAWKSGLDEVWE